MSVKKRKWSENYVQYGFTCATESDGTQHPQCMLCNNKLSNSSLAPAKLREHFTKVRGIGKYAGTMHNQFKQKRAQFNAHASITSYGFVPVDKTILTALYEVVYLIGKHGKPHTIGETPVKPAALRMANIMLGTAAKDKLSLVPLSNDIVKKRIDDISENILHQVVTDLKVRPHKFSLQLDKTTDIANLSQLIAFVCYTKEDKIRISLLQTPHNCKSHRFKKDFGLLHK